MSPAEQSRHWLEIVRESFAGRSNESFLADLMAIDAQRHAMLFVLIVDEDDQVDRVMIERDDPKALEKLADARASGGIPFCYQELDSLVPDGHGGFQVTLAYALLEEIAEYEEAEIWLRRAFTEAKQRPDGDNSRT